MGASMKKFKENRNSNRNGHLGKPLVRHQHTNDICNSKPLIPTSPDPTNMLYSGHVEASKITSVSSIPSRFASVQRAKQSRQYSPLNEYFELMCCSDNASVTSLPNPLPNPKFLSPQRVSHSSSRLSSLQLPCSLPSILEESLLPFLEEYNHLCRKIDPVEAYYFLPTKPIDKNSAKWSAIQSTGKFDGFCNFLGESNETAQPKCLKERGKNGLLDMFWF